ncbi:MAG: hypothetical protein HWN66_21620 [Candidatus Helarchaeota archaeon]|nr:hypothetical protein [Candidatus Helarchaeota archaeon]
MVIRRKKIIINGKEIEVDVFDTRLILGSGKEEESARQFSKEEDIEKEINKAIDKIKKISQRHPIKQKNILYYYEAGQVLQFVDKKNLTNNRMMIWHRIAYDLEPDLFGGKRQKPKEAKRHPEFMYLLSKIDKRYLRKANWDQWYELLKFKDIYKKLNLLEKILAECKNNKLSGIKLRNKIKKLRETK